MKKLIWIIVWIPLLVSNLLSGDMLGDTLKKAEQTLRVGQPQDLFLSPEQEKEKLLEELLEEKKKWESDAPTIDVALSKNIEVVRAEVAALEHSKKEDEFTSEKLSLKRENLDVLNSLRTNREDFWLLLNDVIKSIQEYLDDPDFSKYIKRLEIEDKPFYSLQDLQKVHRLLLNQEKISSQIKDSVKNAIREQEHLKQVEIDTKDQLKKKTKELEVAASTLSIDQSTGLTQAQQEELLQDEITIIRFSFSNS